MRATIIVILLMCSCIGTQAQVSRQKSILQAYYDMQKYLNNDAGLFLKESEKIITDKLGVKFNDANEIIVIKEFCESYNLSGCVYFTENSQKNYFSRVSKNEPINFDKPSYSV